MTQPDYDNLENYNFLAAEVDRHETPQAMALGALLMEALHPKSVIDVGCSSGIYLVPYMNAGIEVLGIDGASKVGGHIPDKFQVVDLRNAWDPPKRFDLAICIEVGEHIRPEFHSLLVETLVKCSDVIFWSAATPGQNGEGHYGEIPFQEWIDKFAAHGYAAHPANGEVQASIQAGQEYEHCHWLKWHSILLSKA